MNFVDLLYDQQEINDIGKLLHCTAKNHDSGTSNDDRFPMELIDSNWDAFIQAGWTKLKYKGDNQLLLTDQNGNELDICWATSCKIKYPGDWYTEVNGSDNFVAISMDIYDAYHVFLSKEKSALAKGNRITHEALDEHSNDTQCPTAECPNTYPEQNALMAALPQLLYTFYM